MLIYLYFDASFPSENVDRNKFSVDVDPKETIENLKVLISLRYTDIDPVMFDIYYRGKKMDNKIRIIDLHLEDEDILAIKGLEGSCPCMLF